MQTIGGPGSLVVRSPLDEARFGMPSARASAPLVAADVGAVMSACRTGGIRFLVARCLTTNLDAAQALESEGFRLMDTLLYFARDLAAPRPEPAHAVRPARPDEAEAVSRLAEQAFRGYLGHYHADPRLSRERCAEIYPSWALRSCRMKDVADAVLLALEGDDLAGFVTLQRTPAGSCEVPLYAVSPALQGRGVGRSLIAAAMTWGVAAGATSLISSTQVTNTASQRVWLRLGFEPAQSYYTFHRWFD